MKVVYIDTICCELASYSYFPIAGRGFTWGHGESLQTTDLPPQPSLSVETSRYSEAEAAGLVSHLSRNSES